MKLAQQLYEAGHITYMRTDSKKYSKEFLEKMKKYIITTYSEQYVSQTIDNLSYDSNSVSVSDSNSVSVSVSDNKAKEAHEAIRPVSIQDKTNLSTDLPQKAIKLCHQRNIAQLQQP
jgi:DNA topoisomerase-1